MKVVMVDQDGVVCDKSYKVTKNINRTIEEARENGILIVPNSDTPVKRLKNNFRLLLNFSPEVVIGEKGAVLEVFGEKMFTSNISRIEDYKHSLILEFENAGGIVYQGDSADWVRNKKLFSQNSRIILLDEQREQSIGLYAFLTDSSGNIFFDADWFSEIIHLIQKNEIFSGLEDFEANKKYGILIANAKGISKTNGFLMLREFFSESNFFMIGDSQDDIIEDKNVIHCAVANAKEELKEVSSFVSESSFTNGLEECLNWIINLKTPLN